MCSCLCFPFLPAEAVPIALHRSTPLRAVGPALPSPRRRLARALGCEKTQPVPERRGFTVKKHSVIQWGGVSSVCCSPGSVQRAQHFSSPTPGCVWAIWGLASAANVGTGTQTEPGLLQVGLRAHSLKTGRLTGNKCVRQLCSLPAKHPWVCSWDLALSPFPLGPAQTKTQRSAGWA